MTPRLTLRPRARRDLLEQIRYLVEHAGYSAAERYYDAVMASCERLAARPLSGYAMPAASARLDVLHGSRNVEAILGRTSIDREEH